jgi:hypothetical protein
MFCCFLLHSPIVAGADAAEDIALAREARLRTRDDAARQLKKLREAALAGVIASPLPHVSALTQVSLSQPTQNQ